MRGAVTATSTAYLSRKPNFDGIDITGVTGTSVANMTWDFVKRLRDTVKGKLVLKGILAHEDAKLAADAGIDGIIVSNHGGRVEDGGRATIDVLPEIVAGGRRPHAGAGRQRLSPRHRHRQGAGAGRQAVCIGRPYLWGSAHSVSPASSACSKSCAAKPAPRCDS